MGKILIANIGNRSLVMRKADGSRIEYDTKSKGKISFKDATKEDYDLMNLDESILESLDSNIIDAIIKEEDSIDRIYLFTSDQAGCNEKQKRNDTLYAGKILSKLLTKKYESLTSVKEIELTGVNVVNLNALTTRFRIELLKLVEIDHPNEKFIICDSGGTPQQKNALKIVAEYFLDKGRVEFYQVYEEDIDENGVIGKSRAEKQDFFQIRKIADAQSISLLINQGEYAAAAYIRKATQQDNIEKLLWLMHYRLLLRDDDAKEQILNDTPIDIWIRFNSNHVNDYPAIFAYLKEEPTGDYQMWKDEFSEKDFFRLCEILEIGRFYYFRDDWSNVVLSYHVFLETFIALKSDSCGYDDSDYRVTSKIKFLERQRLSKPVKNFLADFKQLNNYFSKSTTLNNLRNQIAHEGKGVTRKEIESAIPNFFQMIKNWHNRLVVSYEKDKNAFIQSNVFLQKGMQKE